MRGERRALANVMVKDLVVSGSMERKVMESSVDAIENKLVQAVEKEQVDRGHIPKDIVRSTMPQTLRSEPARIEQDDVSRLNNVRDGMQCARDGSLSQAELIALHLRSYRNILEYDVEQLHRFTRYFASIFVELVDILCYPDRGNLKLEKLLMKDFRVSLSHQLQQQQDL